MSKRELIEALEKILSKIQENKTYLWQDNLKQTVEVIVAEDTVEGLDSDEEILEYNGWLDDISNLVDKLKP